jgi:uncharacterized membrane protein required for colicin V production
MEVLQRLQALDILFAIMWAGIIGWGLQTGLLRQVGMLVGVYGAAILTGSLYRPGGQAMAAAFGRENLPQLEFIAYLVLFVVAFFVIGLLIWRAYPMSRISRRFGLDNLLGGAVATIWGVLLLIALFTILRFYAVVPWHEQEATQRSVQRQIQSSQVGVVLRVAAAPLWQAMVPWFPTPVEAQLSAHSMESIGSISFDGVASRRTVDRGGEPT